MPRVIFVAHDGMRSEVEATVGVSLMRAAVDNGVVGIDGDCGGQCACATCHVFVDPRWAAQLPPIGAHEYQMLDFTAERQEGSRLACQIPVTDALDGLTVSMPLGQH